MNMYIYISDISAIYVINETQYAIIILLRWQAALLVTGEALRFLLRFLALAYPTRFTTASLVMRRHC